MLNRSGITKIEPARSLQLLSQGCVGALLGALLAMLFSRLLQLDTGGRPEILPADILSWTANAVFEKPREKGFYILALILCPTLALITTRSYWRLNHIFIWGVLAISVPITSMVAGQILQASDDLTQISMMMLACLLFIAVSSINSRPYEIAPSQSNASRFTWRPFLFFSLLITLIVLPKSFTEVAAKIGMEFHVASTIIGPALYFYNKNLLPGIDYYTQYSIGQPWVFYHILGTSAEASMRNYTMLAIITTWVFFIQFLYLMRWLYQAWIPAVFVTFAFMIMLFHGDRHFFDPSSSVLRYPLLGFSAWVFAKWAANPDSFKKLLATAAMITLSVFLNTETGIITALAISFTYVAVNRPFKTAIINILKLTLVSMLLFVALIYLVFGSKALQVDFYIHMIAPLLLFGKYGFGGTPILWQLFDLNWLYNLVTPGIVTASLALFIRNTSNTNDKPRLSILMFFAITGLLMMAKFINMSLLGLWHMNALGFLVVLVWWGNVVAQEYSNKIISIKPLNLSFYGHKFTFIVMGLCLAYLSSFASDRRNPGNLGISAWLKYPSLARSVFYRSKKCRDFRCVSDVPSQRDIELITNRTAPGEQVAIIDLYDWAYLVGAKRPPLMVFTPSSIIFTKGQLSESFKRLESKKYLFLAKGTEETGYNYNKEEITQKFRTSFNKIYEKDAEGDKLVAWKRKDYK